MNRIVFRMFSALAAIAVFSTITLAVDKAPIDIHDSSAITWNGMKVEHVFFHPAIVFPELAFAGNGGPRYMNDWFVTLTELKTFLQDMYERGYILVSLRDIFEEKNGKIISKTPLLPQGKKPLLLSVDDLNYYKTMQKRGVTKKLILKNGKLISLVNSPTGEQELEDVEVVTYIDKFVKEHPDFSYRGAKGIIALTGYNGVFGYKTHELKKPEYEKEKADAIKVAQYLKSKGWEFSSHGYRHLQEPTLKPEVLERDVNRWRAEVEPIVGKTNIHIFPCGNPVKEGNPLFEIYHKNGYRYFFGVNPTVKWKMQTDSVYADRIPIDGKYISGRVSGSRQSQFCSITKIRDPLRGHKIKQETSIDPVTINKQVK
jgi:hypothetical protein